MLPRLVIAFECEINVVTLRLALAFLLLQLTTGKAQDHVTNKGATLRIEKGAYMYVSGNYVDDSQDPNQIFLLAGAIRVDGDIINNSNTNELIYNSPEDVDVPGKVILGGVNQVIGGTNRSSFPNLYLRNSGVITLQRNIFIDDSLNFLSGSIELNNQMISLSQAGTLANEAEASRLLANASGRIQLQPATISNVPSNNYKNIGLGVRLNDGSFSNLTISREYQSNPFPVADGIHVLRFFKLTTTTASEQFDEIKFYYHDAELNGLAEDNLALYYSNDGGQTWRKAEGFGNTSSNVFTAQNIPLAASTQTPHDVFNVFALASSTCAPTRRPDVTIRDGANTVYTSEVNVCEDSDITLHVPSNSATFYTWTGPGANVTSPSLSLSSVTDNDAGVYTIFARSTAGCESLNSINIHVRDVPNARFSLSPDPDSRPLCDGEEIQFSDESFTTDGSQVVQWSWVLDNVNHSVAVTQNPSLTYPGPGVFLPSLKAITNYGCTNATPFSKSITIEHRPSAAFSLANLSQPTEGETCEDVAVTFNNESSYHGNYTTTSNWNFGDNTSSAQHSPSHVFNTYGSFNIILTVTDEVTGCAATAMKDLLVNPEPVPQFAALMQGGVTNQVCAGVTLDFTNSSSMPDGSGLAYTWNFGDGFSTTDSEVAKQYGAEGQYMVTLTVVSTLHTCAESTSKIITVHPVPRGTFSVADADICLYEELQITNNATISYGTFSSVWDFGDGNTESNNSSPIGHLYSDARQYKVVSTRTSDQGCVNSFSRTIVVHPTPVPQFAHIDQCDGRPVQFFDASSIQADQIQDYMWSFNDNNATSTQASPSHLFSSYGEFDVNLKVESNFGCEASISRSVNIFRNPSFNLGSGVASCEGQVLLNPLSDENAHIPAGSAFVWRNPQGSVVSNAQNLQVLSSGIYQVTVTTGDNCSATIPIPVYVFQPLLLPPNFNGCGEAVIDFEASLPGEKDKADATRYYWTLQGTKVESQQTIAVTTPGLYTGTIERTVSGLRCESSDDFIVHIDTPIELVLPPVAEECDGAALTLDANIDGEIFIWTKVGSGAVGTTRTLTISDPGVYSVKVINGACDATDEVTVIFNERPQVSFSHSSGIVCQNDLITFQNFTYIEQGSVASVSWDFGDGTTSSLFTPPAKPYSTAGNYIASLSAVSDKGCIGSSNRNLFVRARPTAYFESAPTCAETNVAFTNESTVGSSVTWNFGDGTTSPDRVPSKSFPEAGDYSVLLTAELNGCTSAFQDVVLIRPLPDFQFGDSVTTCSPSIVLSTNLTSTQHRWYDPTDGFTISNSPTISITSNGNIGLELINEWGCKAVSETLVEVAVPLAVSLGPNRSVCDQAVLNPGFFPGAQFSWSTGESTAAITASSSGVYSVAIVDQNGCQGASAVELTVYETPNVNLPISVDICEGESSTLDPGSDAEHFEWSTGATTRTITINASGSYTVIAKNGICQSLTGTDVVTKAVPQASFTVDNLCEGSTGLFTNTTAWSESGISYVWSFGDGTSSAATSPSKRYSQHGSYSVQLTAEASGCQSVSSKQLVVYEQPIASFSVAQACAGTSLTMTNNSQYTSPSNLATLWNWGTATSTSFEPNNIVFASANVYPISLTVTSPQGCSNTYTQNVAVESYPSFPAWQPIIESCRASIELDAGNIGSTYVWSNNATSRTLTVSESGIYSVLVTSPLGCSAQVQTSVVFDRSLHTELPTTIENCGSVVLDPKVNVASYYWSTGANTRTITATQSGQYWIELVSSNLCFARDTVNVVVNAIPFVDLGNNKTACFGESVSIGATSNVPAQYSWSSGQTSPFIDISANGTYKLQLTSDAGCTYADSVQVIFYAAPVLDFPPSVSACGTYTLDAGNEGSMYNWSTGVVNKTLEVTVSGTYSVTVTNAHGCSASDEILVDILATPHVELGPSLELCYGDNAVLDAGTEGNLYAWSNGAQTQTLQINQSGVYSVVVTNEQGCQTSDNVIVVVRAPIPLELGADKLLCNSSVFLSAGIGNAAYQWGSSTGYTSTFRDIYVSEPGKYWVTITDEKLCIVTDSVKVVSTTQKIEANFLIPSVVDVGNIVQFAQLSNPTPASFQWFFGDGGSSQDENPTHRYFRVGEFLPTLIVTNGVCSDTLTKVIIVRQARTSSDVPQPLPQLIEIVHADVYPNPALGEFKLEIKLSAEARVVIQIYNTNGFVLAKHEAVIREDVLDFDLRDFGQGAYFVRVVVNDTSKTLKLLNMSGR